MKVTCKYIVCTYEHLFSQAAKWVKNMEKDNKLVVIKYSDPNYISLIQNAVYVIYHIYYYEYQKFPGPNSVTLIQNVVCSVLSLLTNDRLSNDFSKLFSPFSILPHIIAVPHSFL